MSRAALTLALLLAAPAVPAAPVWIETESPSAKNTDFEAGGWGRAGVLSGGKWLHAAIEPKDAAKVPADGAVLRYDFDAAEAGPHEVWARVGFEFVRSPFRWRIDAGEWASIQPTQLTTDLMALGDWQEVAWLKLGTADLKAGKHALEVRFDRPDKQRLLFGLDCFCISRTPFVPNGPHPPGVAWQTADDVAAGLHTFAAKPAADGKRGETPLAGTWQFARWDEPGEVVDRDKPVAALPDLALLHWSAIAVPGDRDTLRPEMAYAHRYLYRTRFTVPEAAKGQAWHLRFPSTALLATAFVNGKLVGSNDTPTAAWDCDITAAIKPGTNELVVAVKDLYYALARTGDGKNVRFMFNVPHGMFHNAGGLGITRFADFPVLFKQRSNGILETPTLVATGPVYAADVFAQPSVSKKMLELDVTVRNPGPAEVAAVVGVGVEPAGGGKPELAVGPKTVKVPAGGEVTVTLSAEWDKPRLWWPDDPAQYDAVVTVKAGGGQDVSRTKFGFREWGVRGREFTLNGIPWHFRADTDVPSKDADEAVKVWKQRGQNMVRYWGADPWFGATQAESLDHFDRLGMPVRRSGIFDGEVASYALVQDGKVNQPLFDNWIKQIKAWVKAERNHPSVFIWSIENEITYINARNLGWLDQVEPEIKRAIDAVRAVDPTRTAMIDGGDALRNASLPVYGNHYNEFPFREYPDEAYTLALAKKRHTMKGRDPWPVGDDKPLFLGESFFASGYTPSAFAAVGGEPAFLGWPEARKHGVGTMARMLAEGYRWNGVAAYHFWLGSDRSEAHYPAWQPVAMLWREWDTTLATGQAVQRTVRVFNDTRSDEPINYHWELSAKVGDRKKVSSAVGQVNVPPGGMKEWTTEIDVPDVPERTRAELVTVLSRGGKEVFRDVRPYVILPSKPQPKPALAAGDLLVLDTKGPVAARLKERGIPFTAVKDFDALPTKARVVVVGPDALTAKQATDPKWAALAAGGAKVLVLDQEHPLRYTAVPAELDTTGHTGRVAFAENLDHPAFAGLGQEDFFCRTGDHVVYRNAYRKPSRGARSLMQCDEELSASALVECGVGDGVLLLCQVVAGSKLAQDPVCQRLFDNLLNYAADYKPAAKKTAVTLADADPRRKLLDAAGLKYDALPLRDALATAEVVVADADPATLRALADSPDFPKFTARGGWLMLWGLTQEGLASFNRVVKQDHVLRPFRMERVTLPAVRDPLLAGVTLRDVALESTEKIFPWSGDRYPADDTFTHVVDLDDVAPFCKSPNAHGWGQMTNGLTSADAWKFIFYHELKAAPNPSWSAELPKEEEVTDFDIVVNAHYRVITKLRLVFDGDAKNAVTLDLKPEAELRQSFRIDPPRKCQRIALEPVEYAATDKGPTTGVDNLWIKVKRSDEWRKAVVPLCNVGGLVKYRLGERGGVVLNQLKVTGKEANPVNAEKKQAVAAALLRNLGSPFAGERKLIAGAGLRYDPVDLGDRPNAFTTVEKGWFAGGPDLTHLPAGEQTLAGVRYKLADFRTSPVPTCVMLGGDGGRKGLPESVAVPVGKKADALFFLHAWRRNKDWRPTDKEKEPPAAWVYRVRYEDGTTADVPVRYGRGAAPWVQDEPAGLPEASLAWSAPFPRQGDRPQAALYSFAWTNPSPAKAVKEVEVRYADGPRYGVPALFALTAATRE